MDGFFLPCLPDRLIVTRMRRSRFLIAFLLIVSGSLHGQNPYHMNGDAVQENCHCYTLTPDLYSKSGSVWNVNQISLDQSFDYNFDVFLGCTDGEGADGIAFVLQPISISIGTSGSGLGFEGVEPSVAVAIDTWVNSHLGDPGDDHIAIHKNGDLSHFGPNSLAGPVTALANNGNIEDCQTHSLRVTWDAVAKTLTASVDGVPRVTSTIDMVADIFNGNPMVFWGFTGSTGGAKNLHRFCTSLNAGFTIPQDHATCFPSIIPFTDSSTSFGDILRWNWDFGDGTTDTAKTPQPHFYSAPGNYDVKLTILGNNGCTSDTFTKRIVIGSQPAADFKIMPGIVCDSVPTYFEDQSFVEYGTINQWEWDIDGTLFPDAEPPAMSFSDTGPATATLRVYTEEGCVSERSQKAFEVFARPRINFAVSDMCLEAPATFTASNLDPNVNIAVWNWSPGDGTRRNGGREFSYNYASPGQYKVSLFATSDEGCTSPILTDTITVYHTRANAGKDTLLEIGQPYTLKGSGGDLYSWSPATGLNDPHIANPVAVLERDTRFTLTTSTEFGCATTDEVLIKAFKGPEIYVPNVFTPNGDGKNDRFRAVAVGMREIQQFRVYNRYGQVIFESRNSYEGWDGTFQGKAQSSGTYVWTIAGIDFNGKQHSKKGTVTLVR